MLADAAVIAVIIALLRGGKLHRLGDVDIRWPGVIVGAFAIQWGVYYLGRWAWEPAMQWGSVVFTLTLLALVMALWVNRSKPGMALIGLGVFLNLLVVVANGGQMPVSAPALIAAGAEDWVPGLTMDTVITHTLLTEDTRLAFLGDTLVLPRPYPRPKVFSPGDVFMLIGLFILVQRALVPDRRSGPVQSGAPPGTA